MKRRGRRPIIHPCTSTSTGDCGKCHTPRSARTCSRTCETTGTTCKRSVYRGTDTCKAHMKTEKLVSQLLYVGDPNLFKIKGVISCRNTKDGKVEMQVMSEKGELVWVDMKNVSVDMVSEFRKKNPTACPEKGEVYCADRKKGECAKQFANEWFVSEVARTICKNNKHRIIVLDGSNLNTTDRLYTRLNESKIEIIHIPNPNSQLDIRCMMQEFPWTGSIVSLYEMSLNQMIREYNVQESGKLTDVWFDYTGTFSGTMKQRLSRSTPIDDLNLFFEKNMCIDGALLAITASTRGSKLSIMEKNGTIRSIGRKYGFVLTNLCRRNGGGSSIMGEPFECDDKKTQSFTCRESIVYKYGRPQMQMFMYRVHRIKPGDEDIIEDIIRWSSITENRTYRGLVKWRDSDEPTWVDSIFLVDDGESSVDDDGESYVDDGESSVDDGESSVDDGESYVDDGESSVDQ